MLHVQYMCIKFVCVCTLCMHVQLLEAQYKYRHICRISVCSLLNFLVILQDNVLKSKSGAVDKH